MLLIDGLMVPANTGTVFLFIESSLNLELRNAKNMQFFACAKLAIFRRFHAIFSVRKTCELCAIVQFYDQNAHEKYLKKSLKSRKKSGKVLKSQKKLLKKKSE